MSQEIDNKIVSLEFDSSKYDKNVDKSIKITDKLKSSLKFQDVETGFDKINKAIAKVTFSPMEKGIDSVYAKFTMMERFAVQAYDRMANKIINIGKKIADETFVTPRTSGFNEYEQQMDATKIIMTSTGESIEAVNEQLEDLNEYARQTIYSFSDMTNNIGKFTNAGVKLQDATVAMKGISNVAALSGSTAEQASRAMYNFSQALGMGYVATRDWISIENANMATMEFKNQLIETAAEMGTLEKVSDGVWRSLEGNEVTAAKLRDTLSDKWLTSDVLIKTLKKYGDETTDIGEKAFNAASEVRTFSKMIEALKESLQIGWGRTWEILIGNLSEATGFWTSINKVISGFIERMADARNEMLETWKNTGGRNAALAGLVTLFRSLGRILGAIKNAFQEVFPPITGDRLREFSILFEKLMRKLAPSDKTIEKIQRTFRGLFSVFGIVSDAAKAFLKALFPMLSGTKGLASNVLDLTASLGDWITNLRASIKEGRVFETVFGGVAKGLQIAINAIKMAATFIKALIVAFKEKGFTGAFEVIKNGFSKLMSHFSTELDKFHPVDKVKDLGKQIAETIEDWPVIGAISKFIVSIKNKFTNNGVFVFIKNLFIGLVHGVKAAIDGFRDIDTSATDDFTDKLENKFKPITDLFSGLRRFLSSTFKFLSSLLKFIAILGASLFDTLSNVFDNLGSGLGNMTAGDAGLAFAAGSLGALLLTIAKGLKSVSGILANVNSITGQVAKCFGAITAAINAEAITKIAKSIAILTVSLLVLSAIPIEKLSAATAVITALFANLVLTMRSYTKGLTATSKLSVNGSGVQTEGAGASIASIGLQLMLIASAVMTLVIAMAIITAIPYDGLVKGVAVLELLLTSIANVAQKIGKAETVSGPNGVRSTEAVKMGGNILALAVLINVIANSIIKLMIAIAVMDKVTHGEALPLLTMTAVVLIAIMEALASMVFIIQKGATHNESKQMGKYTGAFVGLIFAVSFCLSAVVGALITLIGVIVLLYKYDMDNVLDDAVGVLAKIALGIGIFIAGMLVLLRTLFGANSKDINAAAMTKGIGGLIAVLTIVVLLLGELTGMMAILFGMAVADDQAFTDMTEFIKKMLLAILAIVAVFTIKEVVNGLTGESSQAKQTAKNVLAISAFLITFSYAILAFAAAMTQIGNMPTKGLIKGGITFAVLFAVLLGIVALVGKVKALQTGLMAISGIVKAIAAIMGVIAITFLSIVLSLRIFASFTEEELDNAINNFSTFLVKLDALAPKIATGIANILTMILSAILQSLFGLIQTQFSDTMDFVLNMLTTIEEYAPDILNTIWNVVVIILKSIEERAPEVVNRLVVALISIINGLAKAIDDNRKEILDAVDRLFDAVAGVVTEALGRLMGKTGKQLDKFVDLHQDMVAGISKVVLSYGAVIKGFDIFGKTVGTLRRFGSSIMSVAKKYKYFRGEVMALRDLLVEQGYTGLRGTLKGLIAYFGKTGSEGVSAFTKIKNVVASVGPEIALTAAVIIGNAIKSVIQNMTDAIDAADGFYNETHTKSREALNELKAYKEELTDFGEARTQVMKETRLGESYVDSLKKIVDSTGKIRDGYEQQARSLLPEINSYLGTNLEIENGRLVMLDEENNKIDVQMNKLDELAKKRKLEAQKTALEEEYNKSIEVVNDRDIATRINNARKAMMEANARGDLDEVRNQSGILKEEQYRLERAKAFLATYEEYSKAVDSNDLTTADDLYSQMATGTMAMSENVAFMYQELEDASRAYKDYKELVAAGVWEKDDEYENQVLEQMNSLYKKVRDKADADAETLEGYNVLDRIYSGDYSFLSSYTKGTSGRTGLTTKQKSLISGYYVTDDAQKKAIEEDVKRLQTWREEADAGKNVLTVPGTWEYWQNYAWMLENLTDQTKQELIRQYPELEKAFEGLGEMTVGGFADACMSGDQDARNAAADLAEAFQVVFENEFKIESPSKVMYGYGEYVVEGFVNALTAGQERIKMAAKSMTTTLLTAFSGNLGTSPVITPVIGSPITGNTLGDFQTMVNGMPPLNATVTEALTAGLDISPIVRSNEDLLNEVSMLREEMASMSYNITNMKMVMDTGALVGQLAGPMDTALGKRAALTRKGAY
jgi:hypothetical protein